MKLDGAEQGKDSPLLLCQVLDRKQYFLREILAVQGDTFIIHFLIRLLSFLHAVSLPLATQTHKGWLKYTVVPRLGTQNASH